MKRSWFDENNRTGGLSVADSPGVKGQEPMMRAIVVEYVDLAAGLRHDESPSAPEGTGRVVVRR
jgi:hypothetical protein